MTTAPRVVLPAVRTTAHRDDRAEQWIDTKVAELTLDEKAALTAGADAWTTVTVERLGIPALKVTDGPNGARGDGWSGATAACFPVGTALGATWNPELLEEVGAALAQEARSKGAQVLLAPTVNIHRSPLAGRNFECYSEDPLLTAHLAAAFVAGVQGAGLGTCIKHFVGNESEFERTTISSEIPERALREIYLFPFEYTMATQEPWSVMGAYNLVAGEQACANRRLLVDILKGEWGYSGAVISDWGALHDTVKSANGGCDLEMPGPPRYFGQRLVKAVVAGDVNETEVDDKVRRMLRLVWRAGLVEAPVAFDEKSEDRSEHRALIRRAGAESMVLLKNDSVDGEAVLPLAIDSDRGHTVALIGPNAERITIMGGGSSEVRAHRQVHPLGALGDRIGADAVVHAAGGHIDRHVPKPHPEWFEAVDPASTRGLRITYVDTDDISVEPDVIAQEKVFGARDVSGVAWVWWLPPVDAPTSRRWGVRWDGTFVPDADGEWTFGLAATGRCRALLDGEVVCDNWTVTTHGDVFFGSGTKEVRSAVPVVAGQRYAFRVEYQFPVDEERAAIRFGIAPPVVGNPIADAASAAANADVAVVVVGTDGQWETEGSDRVAMVLPNDQDELIRAVVAANSRTVVVLNTGSPVEMPWIDDVPAVLQAWFGGQEMGDALVDVLFGEADPGGRLPTTFPVRHQDHPAIHNYPGENGQVHYGENVFVGYRSYVSFGPPPLFPFGHGLSYTSFAIAEPEVLASVDDPSALSVSVQIPVTNTGDRPGSTVVQLYVRPKQSRLARPERELKAFGKVQLAPDGAAIVKLTLDHRSFAYFDPAVPGWVADAGEYELLVGTSSSRIAHVAGVSLPTTVVVPLPPGESAQV